MALKTIRCLRMRWLANRCVADFLGEQAKKGRVACTVAPVRSRFRGWSTGKNRPIPRDRRRLDVARRQPRELRHRPHPRRRAWRRRGRAGPRRHRLLARLPDPVVPLADVAAPVLDRQFDRRVADAERRRWSPSAAASRYRRVNVPAGQRRSSGRAAITALNVSDRPEREADAAETRSRRAASPPAGSGPPNRTGPPTPTGPGSPPPGRTAAQPAADCGGATFAGGGAERHRERPRLIRPEIRHELAVRTTVAGPTGSLDAVDLARGDDRRGERQAHVRRPAGRRARRAGRSPRRTARPS